MRLVATDESSGLYPEHRPPVHTPEPQSAADPQGAPWLQVGAHPGGAHRLSVHTNDAQSPLLAHTSPLSHVGEQADGWQVPSAPHTPEPQSASDPQGAPWLHVGAQLAG